MKTTTRIILLSGLAASALVFTSCKDKGVSADASTPIEGEAVAASSDYPLEVCVVSGEKLGTMGEPYVINYEGTEVQFCCDNCEPRFRKDPAKYLAKIEAAQ